MPVSGLMRRTVVRFAIKRNHLSCGKSARPSAVENDFRQVMARRAPSSLLPRKTTRGGDSGGPGRQVIAAEGAILRGEGPMSFPKSLEIALGEGKVIPFVGAGLSLGVRDASGDPLFPGWAEVLHRAAEVLRAEGKAGAAKAVEGLVDDEELLDAAKHAAKGLQPARWQEFLKSQFDRVYADADPASLTVARLVWELGSNLILTTNYDRVLQWTCPLPTDFAVWDIEAVAEQVKALRAGSVARPTAWHLHGHIDNAAEIILTPAGYSNLYADGPKYAAAQDNLRTYLKVNSLLFIGFSLTDADFMGEIARLGQLQQGAANQHFALLRKGEGNSKALAGLGVEPIYYQDHLDLEPLLHELAGRVVPTASPASPGSPVSAAAVNASSSPLPTMPVLSLQSGSCPSPFLRGDGEGLSVFPGRGDAFFKLYDDALADIRGELDIFSLKLKRFRREHERTLMERAASTRIRVALLDPAFPLPEDHVSLAAIREKEERSAVGAIRRDVAEWAGVIARYNQAVAAGRIVPEGDSGLAVRLYNILPTINLFRVDTNLFVGPYLLDVEDRETPTFLLRSATTGPASMEATMFRVYQRHFDAMWNDARTRNIEDVPEDELACWREGRGAPQS
jgi:hypothetical protein